MCFDTEAHEVLTGQLKLRRLARHKVVELLLRLLLASHLHIEHVQEVPAAFVNSFLERDGLIQETADDERTHNMNPAASLTLTVKELEPGEFHWMLLEEVESTQEHLGYRPGKIGDPEPNIAAAWVAGYLALRSILRKSS